MLSIIGITPHPPIIIPEIGGSRLNEAKKTVQGLEKLAGCIKDTEPGLLVIITPHGQVVYDGPLVQTGKVLRGDFSQFGFPAIKVEMQTDQKLLDTLIEETSASQVKLTLSNHNSDQHQNNNLDHGASVPLYYLQENGVNVPGLHITYSFQSYKQLYQFGSVLRRAVEKRGLPAAVLASGDLSHRLKPGAPAGFNPRGSEFDHLLIDLLQERKVKEILEFDQRLVEDAGECGMRSFVIALGMLQGEDFKTDIISYEGPFGVGYLVAALHPE